MGRAPCCDKASVKKGPWAPEEDAVLKAYVDAHGTGGNWIALPHKIGLNRCGKSCRLRWLNYLRPNIRHGGFTEEEDRLICSLYIAIGSRWSTIAAQLPGRTDNDVKNYWNTKLKRRLLGGGRRSRGAPQPRLLLASPSSGSGGAAAHGSFAASALGRMQMQLSMRRHGGRAQQNPGAGFSFYSNLGAPAAPRWPTRPSPSPSLSPAASDNSETTTQLRRHLSTTTTTAYPGFWSHVQSSSSSYTGLRAQESAAWVDGSCTPPLSTTTSSTPAAAGVESSSSTPTASSATTYAGSSSVEDEIDMLLQQISCFGENDIDGLIIGDACEDAAVGMDHLFGAMVGETAVDGGGAGSWSSCSTPGVDSVFHDYVQEYM